MHDLAPAAEALKKLPPDESAQVAAWLVAIAEAVAQSAKTINPEERATIEKIAALFGVSPA
jgi:tellurite resistance protein